MSDDITTIRQSQLDRLLRMADEWDREKARSCQPVEQEAVVSCGINWCRINPTLEMSSTPITRIQWLDVMGTNPSYHKDGRMGCPVENVTYDQCVKFCERIGARLPTEAEWVEAIGTNYDPNSDTAWFGSAPDVVARRQANQFGLYDMFGNVWEWCEGRVLRGGSFNLGTVNCRSAIRDWNDPDVRNFLVGFRVSRTVR